MMSAPATLGALKEPPAAPAPVELAAVANREHALAEQAAASAVLHACQAGEALHAAKEQVGHGNWLPWLGEHFHASVRTAEGYMRLAANAQRVADLPKRVSLRQALAALAEPSSPDEVLAALWALRHPTPRSGSPTWSPTTPKLPLSAIPSAIAASERCKSRSDTITARKGRPPVPETNTVTAWRARLDAAKQPPAATAKAMAEVEKLRANHPVAFHADLDEAETALKRFEARVAPREGE